MSSSNGSNKSSHFKKIQAFDCEFAPTSFTQYESTRTGMRVIVVDREGPKVNGYFTLATEIHDDSGAPHTLEHLCFMGSRSYRFKGILDKFANRAYSDTNAWTATDHTAYTLNTAGWDGFAQILPIYLEHVILPTLTDAGCYTEVWHVDGEGNDAGVVYSEMQGVQNDQVELMDLKARRLMYPDGVGWHYETGGMMEQLRVLTADRIRDFHKEMYQPKNLAVIIVGSVEHTQLLDVLDKFEDSIITDIPSPERPFKRPWVESKPAPPLNQSTVETVEFPEEDESSGEIMINFFGPPTLDGLLCTALAVLLRYLSGSSASILDNVLVEKEELASSVSYSTETRPNMLIQFSLTSVATESLAQVEARFFGLLKEAASGSLDMKYMHDCIGLDRRQTKYAAESSAGVFTNPIIADYLYGHRNGSSLESDLKDLSDYDKLERWTEETWLHWLKIWLSDANHVTILGKPSASLSEKLKSEEKARVDARKEKLGVEGLKDLADKLEKAKAENDRPIPDEMLEKFPVPSTDSIKLIETITARSGLARQKTPLDNPIQRIIDDEASPLSMFIHFEHIKSNFAHIYLVVSTEKVPVQLRPLAAIFLELFFSSPLNRDGQRVEFEEVIKELDRETVGYYMDTGGVLGCSEALTITFIVEVEKYELAIKWLKTLMFSSIIDIERLKTTTNRLLADVPDEKRSGSSMREAVHEMIISQPASATRARSTLVRALYLKWVKKTLKEDPDTIVKQLQTINSALWQPSNFRALVVADVHKLASPVGAWSNLTTDPENPQQPRLLPLETRLSRLSDLGKSPGNTAYIIPLPTIDSSFASVTSSGPSSYDDPSLPSLIVACSYLNAVEGPLWTAVRGTGLAYGTSIRQQRDAGHISLSIYRSPDAFKAYNASKKVVSDHASGRTPIDRLALEGAISSLVLDFTNSEATPVSAAQVSFVRQVVRGQGKDWARRILAKIREVSAEEVQAAMRDVVMPIFEKEKSILVVTCAPAMKEALVKGFEGVGLEPEVKALADFQDDYGFKIGEGEGEDDDDEEEEEDGDEEDEDDDGDEEDE